MLLTLTLGGNDATSFKQHMELDTGRLQSSSSAIRDRTPGLGHKHRMQHGRGHHSTTRTVHGPISTVAQRLFHVCMGILDPQQRWNVLQLCAVDHH